jgi:hypothetical protein
MPARLSLVRRQVQLLRKQFLPDPFDPLGSYPDRARVQANVRAFLVLSHAEFESYLEDWARDIARASERVWQKSGRVTLPLAILATSLTDGISIPQQVPKTVGQDGVQMFSDLVRDLFPGYRKRVNDNHGIKESNVLGLFGPLGVPISAFGSTLLLNLNTLGAARGQHAHSSARAVVNVLDPETEYKKVEDLTNDLAPFDKWLVEFKRRIK